MKKILALVLAAVMAVSMMAVAMADGYPSAPVNVVVPYGAGGGTNLFARVLTDKMSQILG